jgi:hypothetical protein
LIATSVDFIGLFDWHVRLSKSGSPQSRTCLPAGRPSGRRLKPPDGYGTYDEACIERTETFLFGGISRQTKNAFSASSLPAGRQGRLCGENSILDKHDIKKEVTCQFTDIGH